MGAYIRKYGVATALGTHITIPIVKAGEVNFAIGADWTPAAGDVKVIKDDGTPANIATLPTYITSHGWRFAFSLAELQCKKIDVRIVDSATKAIEDQYFTAETFGHASAMQPINFSDIVRMGLTALPSSGTAATPANVNEQVLDVMNVDTHDEPGQGAPGKDVAIFTKINFLYKSWRNKKVQDNTTYELYDDAGVVVDQKASDSDNGTDASIGKIISGL